MGLNRKIGAISSNINLLAVLGFAISIFVIRTILHI